MAEGLRLSVVLLVLLVVKWAYSTESVRKCENTPMKQIICEFGTAKAIANFDACLCTHIAIPVNLDSEKDDDQTPDFTSAIKSYRETNGDLKSLAAVSTYAEDVAKKSGQIRKEIVDVLDGYDGVQLDLRQSDVSVDKSLVVHFFKELSSEIDSKFRVASTNNSLESFKKTKEIQLVLPPNAAILTKFYDLKKLTKFVDFFIIATHNLVDISEQGYTYHPSRLMGTDDLLNADVLIDLVTGLGVDHLQILISLPSTASKFELKDSTKNTPRAPAIGLPTTISRQKMCEEMNEGNWTIERDEDLTAPYAFMNTTWMSFDDSVSVSIKGKYILLRDLAGAVVTDVEALDWKLTCLNQTEVEPLKELAKTFTETARKSRSAQLLSLQEQLQRPADQGFYFNNEISYSPYYIERVVTRDGEVHVIRKDTKTEFECSRQGYFRHPSGCNRFYRCVKFDQQSNYFTVYEFDCPDGLVFDEKVEVCVWPGSLSNTGACQGSNEIAPVPRNQFVCPSIEGYYADPENCRWFFACLDHARDGYTPLTAYEFRCPFGLVFDEKSLKCDWPWKVGSCGNYGRTNVHNYGEQLYAAQPYQTNQLNALYEKEPFFPYAKYNQEQPQFSFDSVDSYVTPSKFNFPYSTTGKPQLLFGSTENYVTQNSPEFLHNSARSFVPPSSTQIPYSSPDKYYVSTVRPQTFYGSETYSSTNRPQYLYGFTGTTLKPELAYGSTESYATTSKPQLFYSSTDGRSSPIKPQHSYSSTETYATTGKPQFSYEPYKASESYSTTSKPQFSYGPYGALESYSTTIKPQFTHNEANSHIVPNQPGRPFNFDYNAIRPEAYNQFDGPSGILYHQQHEPEIVPKYRNGVLLHLQNNFHGIPVNQNYDSHKNDIQYPPIKDYETYSTTQGPLNKIFNSRLYAENYSPSNIYSGPSIPYTGNPHKSPYSILGEANGFDSHKVNEHYQPSYNFEIHSTTQEPIIKSSGIPSYSHAIFNMKPTSKSFKEYFDERSRSNTQGEINSQYSTTDSPSYVSSTPLSINFNDIQASSTTQKPEFHDTSLYKEHFKSQFNFEDYQSRISSPAYPSTTPAAAVDYTPSSVHGNSYAQTSSTYPSTTPKPTAFYYSSPSPTLSAYKDTQYDVQSYSTTPRPNDNKPPISTTYSLPEYSPAASPNAYSSTFRPTVNYYSPPTAAAAVSYDDDSAFVERLISELSKNPIPSASYSTSTPRPRPDDDDYRPHRTRDHVVEPNGSFDVDQYIAILSEPVQYHTTPKPLQQYSSAASRERSYASQPLPTSVYLQSSTDGPAIKAVVGQEPYAAVPVRTVAREPQAPPKTTPPETRPLDVPSLIDSVYSARPPATTYTARPEPLPGYSSTASDLIDTYYHDLHSSLDSAYRSPFPRRYPAPVGHSLDANYTLPRGYERDAGHTAHVARPIYPLKPIIVEQVSPELNAEFERYYTTGVRTHLQSEDDGKVLVVGDTSPPLIGKLGAQCDCAARKLTRKPATVVSTTTRTVVDGDDDGEKTAAVKEVETRTRVVLEDGKRPSVKQCTRPGLFRDPKQCNKFYSCNWDKWTQKYQISDFKCPIHLAFDENLSACNWPSKGPACSHDTLIGYTN